jgi:hypothetical protein
MNYTLSCTSTNLIFITHQHLGQELVLHAWMVKQFIFTKQCSSASKNIKIPIWLLFTSQRCSSKQLIHISLLFCKRVYNSWQLQLCLQYFNFINTIFILIFIIHVLCMHLCIQIQKSFKFSISYSNLYNFYSKHLLHNYLFKN